MGERGGERGEERDCETGETTAFRPKKGWKTGEKRRREKDTGKRQGQEERMEGWRGKRFELTRFEEAVQYQPSFEPKREVRGRGKEEKEEE